MKLMNSLGLQPVLSPCVGVCTLDESGICVGCHRTTHEISHWMHFSDSERDAIMAALEERARHRGGG